jgi:hypothetical protein
MNENNLGRRAKVSLDGALEKLDRQQLERLAQARHAALDVYVSPLRHRAGVLAGGMGRVSYERPHARQWVSLMALLLGLFGAYCWLDHDVVDDEVDAVLLADDLPLQAYVDHQFDKWLAR